MIPIYLMVLGSITIAYEIVCFIQIRLGESANSFIWMVIGWFLALGFIGWVITGMFSEQKTNTVLEQ